ncbi:MAG: hypothetical protein DLM59_14960 [Pseudonocardiales bacterium]|nr:MAG: hypothetical protein DLM59_14960 [Pseudonocardiales bacterium]
MRARWTAGTTLSGKTWGWGALEATSSGKSWWGAAPMDDGEGAKATDRGRAMSAVPTGASGVTW